jgi:hypothetical protein
VKLFFPLLIRESGTKIGENKEKLKSENKYSLLEVYFMAYTYQGWTLYTRDVKLKGGRMQTIYFFSKRTPKSGRPCDMPNGYIVGVNKRTGLPYLKKK